MGVSHPERLEWELNNEVQTILQPERTVNLDATGVIEPGMLNVEGVNFVGIPIMKKNIGY